MPAAVYNRLKDLAPLFNLLMDRVARDTLFLQETLAFAAKADEAFTGKYMGILQQMQEEKLSGQNKSPEYMLGMFRNDFMLHDAGDGSDITPLQIEFNTIAASFGPLSGVVSSMHQYFASRHLQLPASGNDEGKTATLPENPTRQVLAQALGAAARNCPAASEEDSVRTVVMIVQEGETNSFDQRWLEWTLWEQEQVPLVRLTLAQIADLPMDPETGDVKLEDGSLAGVFYYRAGYTPRDFPSEKQWDAVVHIERSSAIKCPSVAYHMAGTKKVQQQLSVPGVLERFLPEKSPEVIASVRSCFAGIWGLERDDESTQAVIAQAIAHPDAFVLKPQREGGGNNLWAQEMVDKLQSASLAERSQYILMQRIMPDQQKNVLMRNGATKIGECLSELGIYSTFLSDGSKSIVNRFGGALASNQICWCR